MWRVLLLIVLSFSIIFSFSFIATHFANYQGIEELKEGQNVFFNVSNCKIYIVDTDSPHANRAKNNSHSHKRSSYEMLKGTNRNHHL